MDRIPNKSQGVPLKRELGAHVTQIGNRENENAKHKLQDHDAAITLLCAPIPIGLIIIRHEVIVPMVC